MYFDPQYVLGTIKYKKLKLDYLTIYKTEDGLEIVDEGYQCITGEEKWKEIIKIGKAYKIVPETLNALPEGLVTTNWKQFVDICTTRNIDEARIIKELNGILGNANHNTSPYFERNYMDAELYDSIPLAVRC